MHPGDGRREQALRLARRHVIVAVKEAVPDGTVKKGEVARAVVVRTVKEVRRRTARYIRFDRNAVVLLKPDDNPVGHAHLRAGGARASGRQFTEDHLARPRSHLRTCNGDRRDDAEERHRSW